MLIATRGYFSEVKLGLLTADERRGNIEGRWRAYLLAGEIYSNEGVSSAFAFALLTHETLDRLGEPHDEVVRKALRHSATILTADTSYGIAVQLLNLGA